MLRKNPASRDDRILHRDFKFFAPVQKESAKLINSYLTNFSTSSGGTLQCLDQSRYIGFVIVGMSTHPQSARPAGEGDAFL